MASSKLCGISDLIPPKRRKIWFEASNGAASSSTWTRHPPNCAQKLSDSMIDFLCEQFKIKDREWVMPVGGLIDLNRRR